MIKLAVIKETHLGETRSALTPEHVKAYQDIGCEIMVEKGSGLAAGWTDSDFQSQGVNVMARKAQILKQADVCLKIQPPSLKELDIFREGTACLSLLMPSQHSEVIQKASEKKIDLFSLSLIPRISRAQAMDVLSSQANLAGYRSVIEAGFAYPGVFPMMMTAAGRIAPARVFIMGVGVAGLQAIATARRLGAIVSATDVRPATKEQVASLGAQFIAVEDEEFKQAETQGGHAKAMSKAYQQKQAELIQSHIQNQDIIITTALIPGKKAPVLLPKALLKTLKPGTIIIDLAASQGGNSEGVKPDETVTYHGVKLIGFSDLATHSPKEASRLYANNLFRYFSLLYQDGHFMPNREDEIIKASWLTSNGQIFFESLKTLLLENKERDL